MAAPLDWDKLRIFHAAAEAGSFTHAAQTLHMSQSAISRQVSALEQDVGVPLFQRHARGLIMTEQRSEERRVGKKCRSRRGTYIVKTKY